jgi:hypothetical protein
MKSVKNIYIKHDFFRGTQRTNCSPDVPQTSPTTTLGADSATSNTASTNTNTDSQTSTGGDGSNGESKPSLGSGIPPWVSAIVAVAVFALFAVFGVFLWRRRRQSITGRDDVKSTRKDEVSGSSMEFLPVSKASEHVGLPAYGGKTNSVSMEGIRRQRGNAAETAVRDSGRSGEGNVKVLMINNQQHVTEWNSYGIIPFFFFPDWSQRIDG